MSDILSQEQIDALLNSEGLSAGNDSSGLFDMGSGSENKQEKFPILNDVYEIFCAQATTVISTVLNKSAKFSPNEAESASYQAIQEKIQSVVVSVALSFKAGFEGEFYVLIKKNDVAVLSDLMMMGDGSAEYSEDHKDAIGELFNQVMGAFTNVMGSDRGIQVSAGNVTVSEFDLDNPPLDAGSLDMVLTELKIEGFDDSWISILVPAPLTDQIVEAIGKNSSSMGGGASSVGLNMSELDDLSRVTSFDSSETHFTETNLAGQPVSAPQENISMLLDIELDVSIELGRSILSIKRILELAPGSVVELDRLAGEPVDLLVNNKIVARGEVVVIDENFGIRIVSLVSPEERIKSLR
jgi:flagellar motor switch protein FliN/FliY